MPSPEACVPGCDPSRSLALSLFFLPLGPNCCRSCAASAVPLWSSALCAKVPSHRQTDRKGKGKGKGAFASHGFTLLY